MFSCMKHPTRIVSDVSKCRALTTVKPVCKRLPVTWMI